MKSASWSLACRTRADVEQIGGGAPLTLIRIPDESVGRSLTGTGAPPRHSGSLDEDKQRHVAFSLSCTCLQSAAIRTCFPQSGGNRLYTYLMFQHFPRDRRDERGKNRDGSVQRKTAMLRNSEEAPVLCGGRSSPVGDVCTFIFAVLKEDGQFLESLMSGPGG